MQTAHPAKGEAMQPARPSRDLARDESGLTLLELLVTLTIIAILISIAVPVFLGFTHRASKTAAEANLRSALPSVEQYYEVHATYDAAGMTPAALTAYDQALAPGISVVSGSDTTYCIKSTQGTTSAYKNGPGAPITETPCT
jgi:prepilin-type N-terminal cleavage/methylation domain-containing protein